MLPFDRLFCGQHFCQKLSKSDDVHFKAIAFNIIGVVFWRHSVDTERWLGSRAVSVLDSSAVRPGFKSQPRRCRVTVLGKLFTPIVPLFTKQQNW